MSSKRRKSTHLVTPFGNLYLLKKLTRVNSNYVFLTQPLFNHKNNMKTLNGEQV